MYKIMQDKIIEIPNPFKLHKYKGFKFKPVLDPKAGVKFTRWGKKQRIIYYNPFFVEKLTPGQKLFLALSSIKAFKTNDIFKADEAAFQYLHKKYGVTQDEVGNLLTSMNFVNKEHKNDRILNMITESVATVKLRKAKAKIINFLKSLITWKKKN